MSIRKLRKKASYASYVILNEANNISFIILSKAIDNNNNNIKFKFGSLNILKISIYILYKRNKLNSFI